MARRPARTWTQMEVAVLSRLFALHPEDYLKHAKFAEHTPTEVTAKLVELELLPKPQKAVLAEQDRSGIEAYLTHSIIGTKEEPQRTLAIRYAIAHLQALLPKRTRKDSAQDDPAAP